MSWLDDLEYNYRYKCTGCGEAIRRRSKEGTDVMRNKFVLCPDCGSTTEYEGFDAEPCKQTHRVEYEQNGRKAVAIRGKDGKMKYVSKTKLNYLKTGRSDGQYTKGYQEQIDKENQEQALRAAHEKGKGKVERLKTQKLMEEMVKDLPDGEYASDGVTAEAIRK